MECRLQRTGLAAEFPKLRLYSWSSILPLVYKRFTRVFKADNKGLFADDTNLTTTGKTVEEVERAMIVTLSLLRSGC